MRRVLAAMTLAAWLGPHGVAQGAALSPIGEDAARNCTYYPTGPPPYVPGLPPHVEYDATSHLVTVAMAFFPNAEVREYFPVFLSTMNHGPERLKAEGPIPLADAIRRFGVPSSTRNLEYWVLKGILPFPAPFVVYFDEVSHGIDANNLPCSSSSRHVVAAVAEGAQRENERGSSALLPFVKLALSVSTETLTFVAVATPNSLRLLNPQSAVRSVVRFRSGEFRQRPADQVLMNLDTRRGFDISITTFTSYPGALEYRYVIGQGDEAGSFAVQRFAWSAGDAVAETDTKKVNAPLQRDSSYLLPVDAGHDNQLLLHIRPVAKGVIEIFDVSAVR